MPVVSASELASLETELGHPFPDIYRELLTVIGHGRREDGRVIYHPREIEERYAHHFENSDDLFGRYFPIGDNEYEQTIWLMDLACGKVATIDHETHPDDYPDEEWLDPNEWRSREELK